MRDDGMFSSILRGERKHINCNEGNSPFKLITLFYGVKVLYHLQSMVFGLLLANTSVVPCNFRLCCLSSIRLLKRDH